MLCGELPGRLATETEQLQRIRESLGWGPFDASARARVTTWLTQRATDDLLPSDLVARTEAILRSWQIVLPALSTLEELVASVTVRAQDEVYTRIAMGLSADLQQAMDDRNGMITNDKFCCTRWSPLQLSWWRRPLRLRQEADHERIR